MGRLTSYKRSLAPKTQSIRTSHPPKKSPKNSSVTKTAQKPLVKGNRNFLDLPQSSSIFLDLSPIFLDLPRPSSILLDLLLGVRKELGHKGPARRFPDFLRTFYAHFSRVFPGYFCRVFLGVSTDAVKIAGYFLACPQWLCPLRPPDLHDPLIFFDHPRSFLHLEARTMSFEGGDRYELTHGEIRHSRFCEDDGWSDSAPMPSWLSAPRCR